MSKKKSTTRSANSAAPANAVPTPTEIENADFENAFNETIDDTLNLATWVPGENLPNLYARLEREINTAVDQEDGIRQRLRAVVFPQISTAPLAPPCAGHFQIGDAQKRIDLIERMHRHYLFNGQVEACDGTMAVHDTLPITIVQIGVSLVSYQGDQGTWLHRMFRRDLRASGFDPVAEALEMLQRRRERNATGEYESMRDTVSSLLARGIMAYAERAVLLRKSTTPWRMGHGAPAPYELLTGSGNADLLEKSLPLLHSLIDEHQRFIYVPSRTDRSLLTLGHALRPLEYIIYGHVQDKLEAIAGGNYRGERWKPLAKRVEKFAAEVGPKIVRGVFRASAMAPPYAFYAHVDHAHEAALIAMADATLQDHRGFPMLIDLADTVCSTTFGGSSLDTAAQVAYAEAGAPFQHLSERSTRS